MKKLKNDSSMRISTGEAFVDIWRRGRGIMRWAFLYYPNGYSQLYPSPGWYLKRRVNVYRLTVDHRFPNKVVYIGYKKNGVWVNAESLYEPINVRMRGFVAGNRNLNKPSSRSARRIRESLKVSLFKGL